MNTQEKFKVTFQEMCSHFLERDAEVQMGLVGLLAKQNVFFVGSHGLAKSAVCDALVSWINGKKFSLQLSMYSTPEEVFGHVSVKKYIDEDKYVRIIEDGLPNAHIAFLDEPFNASSAILNSMNKVLNEGEFKNGADVVKCPLQCCFGASNLTPVGREDGKNLAALFDRFILRKEVVTLQDESSWEKLFDGAESGQFKNPPRLSTSMDVGELLVARVSALALPLSKDIKPMLHDIRRELANKQIHLSIRRWVRTFDIIRANAYIDGEQEVLPRHLSILETVLWEHPTEHPQIVEEVIGKIANPDDFIAVDLMKQAKKLGETAPESLVHASQINEQLCSLAVKLQTLRGARVDAALQYIENKTQTLLAECAKRSALGLIRRS